jgi:hypothetical protein
VGGQPSAAGWRLLDLLAAGGAEFRYHGDFDWGGIRIASAVRRRAGRDPLGPEPGGRRDVRIEEELSLDSLLADLTWPRRRAHPCTRRPLPDAGGQEPDMFFISSGITNNPQIKRVSMKGKAESRAHR